MIPIPSTMSRVRRNGTISGVLRKRPCSNATPRSMWTTLAVRLWMRMLELWRSPSPMTWPGRAASLAIICDLGQKGRGGQTAIENAYAAVMFEAHITLRHGGLSLVGIQGRCSLLRQLLQATVRFMPSNLETPVLLTRHGVDSDASRVSQAALEPRRRLPKAFVEEVAHDRRELLPDVRHPAGQLGTWDQHPQIRIMTASVTQAYGSADNALKPDMACK